MTKDLKTPSGQILNYTITKKCECEKCVSMSILQFNADVPHAKERRYTTCWITLNRYNEATWMVYYSSFSPFPPMWRMCHILGQLRCTNRRSVPRSRSAPSSWRKTRYGSNRPLQGPWAIFMCQQKGAFAVILFSPLRGVVHIVWKLRVFFTTCHLCSCSQLCISSYKHLRSNIYIYIWYIYIYIWLYIRSLYGAQTPRLGSIFG